MQDRGRAARRHDAARDGVTSGAARAEASDEWGHRCVVTTSCQTPPPRGSLTIHADATTTHHPGPPIVKIISWNLLRQVGATPADVVDLVRREKPDLLLMQEVTQPFDSLCDAIGGSYAWEPQPGRIHGLAMWSATPWRETPVYRALRPGAWFQRIGQIVTVGDVGIANVHLSHGQRLNRRQLRQVAEHLPPRAAVLGDFNLVGPTLLKGFQDVGPRWPTHRMGDILPLRIDRCLVRGLVCDHSRVLPRQRSDHRPISVELSVGTGASRPRLAGFIYRAITAEGPHRADAPEGAAPAGPAPATGPAGGGE